MFGNPTTPFGGFGQQTNTAPAFGSPPASSGGLFGSTAQTPAFGAPPSTGFGSAGTGGFGAPAAPSGGGLFGSSNTGGAFGSSGFGSPAPAPFGATSTGGGGLFGSSAPATGFGAQSTTFGSSVPSSGGALFGSTPQPGTSLFGAQQQQQTTFGSTGGGFGAATTTTSTFGGPASGGLFGSPAPAAPFGAPAPSAFGNSFQSSGGGLFGSPSAPTATTAAFGSAPSTLTFGGAPVPTPSAFGVTPAPAGGGLFGGSTMGATSVPTMGGVAAGAGGTRAVPYEVTNRQDQNSNSMISMHDITAMQQYENKSPEELRFEDYSQGNRGTVAPMGGGFGAPAPSGGLFGSPAPAPGGFGAFGSPAPGVGFGSAATGAFGAPAPSTGGLFGSPSPAPGFSFGSTSAPAPTTGMFSSTAPTSTFGSPAPAQAFGSPPAPAPFGGFGAPAPAPGSLFGSTTSTFGSSAPGGLFGAPSPAPFGAPAPSGGLFGSLSTPAPAPFGAPAPAGGLFGQPAPAPSAFGGFGSSTGTSLFGSSTPAPAPSAFGSSFGSFGPTSAPTSFGQPAPAPGFGYSTSTQPPTQPSFTGGLTQQQPILQQQPVSILPPNLQIMPPGVAEVLEQQVRALEHERKELEKSEVWRGSPAKAPATTPTNLSNPFDFVSSPKTSTIPSFTPPTSSVIIQPRGIFPKSTPSKPNVSLTPIRLENRPMLLSPEQHLRSSKLQLVLKPESLKHPSRLGRRRIENPGFTSPTAASVAESVDVPPTEDSNDNFDNTLENTSVSLLDSTANNSSPKHQSPLATTSPGFSYYQKVIASTKEDNTNGIGNATAPSHRSEKANAAPTLTKNGYIVTPPLDELSAMSEADLAAVQGFSIARPGYGKIEWDGAVDVRSANVDRIVSIESQDVSVYTEDEEEGTKPLEGSKLNRSAVITFYDVFPKNGGSQASDSEREKFAFRVKRSTEKMGAEFLSYDTQAGVWKIRVPHFSRYSLLDADEDDSEDTTLITEGHKPTQYSSLATRKATPFKPSRVSLQVFDNIESMEDDNSYKDDVNEDSNVVSDIEMSDTELLQRIEREAEIAFHEVYTMTNKDSKVEVKQHRLPSIDKVSYDDQGVDDESFLIDNHLDVVDAYATSSKFSITNKLRSSIGVEETEICHGARFGRSFRVGWCPDGSFVKLSSLMIGPSPVLVKAHPVFSDETLTACSQKLIPALKDHSVGMLSSNNKNTFLHLPQLGTDASAKKKILLLLDELAAHSANNPDSAQGFRLLSLVLCNQFEAALIASDGMNSQRFPNEARVLSDVQMLLVNLCSNDVGMQVELAKSRGDQQSAIVIALAGGDMELACDLAVGSGFLHLATALSTSSEGRDDIRNYLFNTTKKKSQMANSSSCLVLKGLVDNLTSKASYGVTDWAQFMLLQMQQEQFKSVKALVANYERNLEASRYPYPYPRFQSITETSKSMSTLYRLLSLFGEPKLNFFLESLDPFGYSPEGHDYSFAFYLATAISVFDGFDSNFVIPSSTVEFIVDSYATQLINSGSWVYAIFIMLYGISRLTPEIKVMRINRAKSILLRNFNDNYDESGSQRDFLVEVGVPLDWFDEALAYRSAALGDTYDYIKHSLAFEPEKGFIAFQEFLLPSLFFEATPRGEEMLSLTVSSISLDSNKNSLAASIMTYIELDKSIQNAENIADEDVDYLLESYEFVERTLRVYDSEQNQGWVLDFSKFAIPPPYIGAPAMVAEARRHLQYLKIQINALKENEA